METKQIINGLLDRADRVADQSAGRIMRQAADRLKELDTENDELEQRLFVHRELNKPQKWIPVTERLPKDSGGVILCTRSRNVGVGFYDKNTRNWVQHYSGGGICVDVTHWMPLPEPPKEV